MKTFLAFGVLMTAMACGAVELKVATLDLQRVLSGYYKSEEAAKELHAKEVSFRKELDDLRLELGKREGEIEDLRKLSLDNALHADVREEKKKTFELKLVDLRTFQVKAEGIRTQLETEWRGHVARTHERLLDDILKATNRVGEKEGFNLILNASKAQPATSDVLFARAVEDLTPKVLAALNASRPATPQASEKQ